MYILDESIAGRKIPNTDGRDKDPIELGWEYR
jgi:hypothetical protein